MKFNFLINNIYWKIFLGIVDKIKKFLVAPNTVDTKTPFPQYSTIVPRFHFRQEETKRRENRTSNTAFSRDSRIAPSFNFSVLYSPEESSIIPLFLARVCHGTRNEWSRFWLESLNWTRGNDGTRRVAMPVNSSSVYNRRDAPPSVRKQRRNAAPREAV